MPSTRLASNFSSCRLPSAIPIPTCAACWWSSATATTISAVIRARDALDIAQRAGIVIYTISTSINWILTDQEVGRGDLANRKVLKDEGDRVLQQFSDESGGRVFFPYRVDDLAQSFGYIGDELRSQYSLAYVPTRPADGKFHKIRIDVNTKGLQVRARKGYYATAPQAPDSPVSTR